MRDISSSSQPNTKPSWSTVIHPGDVISGSSREVSSQDNQEPFAHELVGIGTLRDVREEKFYRGGTLTVTLESHDDHPPIPVIYDPYPEYNSAQWHKEFAGKFYACEGPRGKTLSRSSAQDMVSVYPDFPPPMLGSYQAMGVDENVCSDRFSRLGAYGYESNTTYTASASRVNWNETNWGSLQSQCFERNVGRYLPSETNSAPIKLTLPVHSRFAERTLTREQPISSPHSLQYKPRSAIILRAWHDIEWTENLKQTVRSLVMELSLHSGGEYEVFLLVHVKDESIPIYSDDAEVVKQVKAQFIPHEFHDMAVLFNEKTLESWYPRVEEHSTNFQYWQPVQIFSRIFQDFEFYWQLEMDSRFTGHSYHFLEKSAEFAKRQPRKYLWERNAYFYIPGAHGIWQNFINMVDFSMRGRKSVWGPMSIPQITPIGPKPPVAFPEHDDYEWGVGEEADLITFIPIFDPTNTQWLFRNMLWGLPEDVPRRTSPVAMGRVSRKLLHQMHIIQIQRGLGLVSEMTPPSLALWHGLKAVHVPHPLYLDGKWTPKEIGRIMNPGEADKINGGPDSFWNWDHLWDHILYRLTYMFTTQTAEDFYRRWLGYPIDPNQYTDGTFHQDGTGRNWFETGDLREDLYGPLCFPSMLLHTIKNTEERKGTAMVVPV
ncbi:Protein of unknown function DUF3405 [Penicillium italicum]|uniref:Uncharacterized protein n=1 Tax=Penicillium italicum TaxID=40296 RepID=A0A0A2KPF6_PENIT|nr:Protein of unknown function DUF3405 [Penicillium italicum]